MLLDGIVEGSPEVASRVQGDVGAEAAHGHFVVSRGSETGHLHLQSRCSGSRRPGLAGRLYPLCSKELEKVSLRHVPKQNTEIKVLRITSKGFAGAVAYRAVTVALQCTELVHFRNSGCEIIYIHGFMTPTAW